MNRPSTPASDAAGRPRRRRATDLTADEAPLAAWFEHLERPEAPLAVRRALMADRPVVARAGWVHAFPLGAWGVASAALLLAALGLAVSVELIDPVHPPAEHRLAGNGLDSVSIFEDSTMVLFHDLETFDEVGLPPGELIADWGR